MIEDTELLCRFVEEGADDAFSELVRRHIDFVYSAAVRQLNGDAHLAADATQLVFTDLARKAKSLTAHRMLAGWLFTSTRYTTAKLIRGERRRKSREQEAQLMPGNRDDGSPAVLDWDRVRPVLDDVIGQLRNSDREAILLRFFAGCDYASVGAKLNVSDNTARMRVERALEKLRALLQRRGVKSTSAALAVALADQAVLAAPAGLAAAVTGAALGGGAVAAGVVGVGTAAAGAGGLLGFMSMTKLQLGFSSALAVAGASGVLVQATTNARLRDEADRLHRETAALPVLQSEVMKLGRLAAEVEDLRRDDTEFVRLQREAGVLRIRLQELARDEARRKAHSAAAYEITMLDQTPAPRFQNRPQYPSAMRRAGISGEVVVDFVVDRNGDVQNAWALRSSRHEFEAAAVQAVSEWKFKPGKKGGQDVATHLQVPIVFTVEGKSAADTPAPGPNGAIEENGTRDPTVKMANFDVVASQPKPASQAQPSSR